MRITFPLNHLKSNINQINNNGLKLYSTSVPKDLIGLKNLYKKLKFQSFNSEFDFTLKNYLPNINRVFTHKEVNLKYIQVFGYDYDYTLANYTSELPNTIYSLILNQLVDRLNYPKQLLEKKYDPYFAIRGLHYDVTTGWLMKVDAYHNIQVNTVYFGREPLDNTQLLLDLHKGTHISPAYMRDNLVQLNDMFSLPEICLLADIIQYFKDQKIQFHPRNLYSDVRSCAESIHAPSNHMSHGVGILHSHMIKNIEQYLKPSPRLETYLNNLRSKGKKTFLLTNSAYSFVDKGLAYITGNNNWPDLFDVAIVGSKKPRFYNWKMPFRQLNIDKNNDQISLGLNSVNQFERGRIYQGGNVKDFSDITGWTGQKVLYIGDHVYSDLVDPTTQEGWRTGAIINELDQEITLSNLPESRHKVTWVNNIEHVLRFAQSLKSGQVSDISEMNRFIEQMHNERKEMRLKLKRVVNYQFGSVFRTHNNPSYFSNKIRTYADLYTSRLDNFELYPDDYVFYPKRGVLPHEYVTLDRSLS